MKHSDIKKGMILRLRSDYTNINGEYYYSNVIVLPITKKDLHCGIHSANTDHIGLHGFRGMWYGRDRNKRRSFGKIYDLDCYSEDEISLVMPDTVGISNRQLKEILA